VQDLVVEDSTTIRMILRQLLSKTGFKVVEASNGLEGLERLKEMDQNHRCDG
jgi:CheY-like chemotaxis protein